MMKLILATLLALLIPTLWVAGAKAQSQNIDHARAWSQTSDSSGLTSAQRQSMKARDTINERITQMYDGFRMMNPNGAHYQTARGLVVAAENIQSYSNGTSDYFTIESYSEQIRGLQTALQVLVRLR